MVEPTPYNQKNLIPGITPFVTLRVSSLFSLRLNQTQRPDASGAMNSMKQSKDDIISFVNLQVDRLKTKILTTNQNAENL
jgi:hypothetical protein